MIEMRDTHNGYEYYTSTGEKIPIILTKATGLFRADLLHALFNQDETEITHLTQEYHAKREWNFANTGKGKDWPVFKQTERYINRLKKSAGIVDT